jgi:hypothetical protein
MMDPSSVEDFYNALTNPQANGGAGLPTQDPQATLASALNAPPPTVQMPQRDQPDMSMLPSLSLLRLAASLSQRRYNGQSRLGQLTAGLADAGDFAMNQKKQLVDQSNEKYRQDVLAAGTQANIAATNAQAEATRTKTAVEKASAPLNMTGLSIAIDTARDEGQLKKLQVKLSTIASNYAAQKAQAELDLQAAQTDKARADAQAALSNATANLQTAQAHLQTAQAHMGRLTLERDMFEEGKRQGSFKTTANLPGEPSTFQYTDTRGNVMVGTMPIDQPQAIKKAKDDWKQVKDLPDYKNMTQDQYIQQRVQSLTNPPTWNAAINDMQSRKNAANGVAPTGVNMPPPAGVPGAVPPPDGPCGSSLDSRCGCSRKRATRSDRVLEIATWQSHRLQRERQRDAGVLHERPGNDSGASQFYSRPYDSECAWGSGRESWDSRSCQTYRCSGSGSTHRPGSCTELLWSVRTRAPSSAPADQ